MRTESHCRGRVDWRGRCRWEGAAIVLGPRNEHARRRTDTANGRGVGGIQLDELRRYGNMRGRRCNFNSYYYSDYYYYWRRGKIMIGIGVDWARCEMEDAAK